MLYSSETLSLTLREEFWKQNPKAYVWAQEGCEWGVAKAPQRGIS